MDTVDTALNVLSIVSGLLTPICMALAAVRTIQEFISNKNKMSPFVSLDKSPKENHLSAAEYIGWRNLLKLQAEQDAKKRQNTLFVNSISLVVFAVFLGVLPWLHELLSSTTEIASSSNWILLASYAMWQASYYVSLFCLIFLIILTIPLLFFNVPSWRDLMKKGRYNLSLISPTKHEYSVHISRAIDIASHFDMYLLFDADPRDTNLGYTLPKDRVIGAININEKKSICDMIEPYLSEKLVVFIYSRHGKASYEQTQEARKRYPYVYDLGPVCGDMRELEIVAHQLYYLQDNKCLRLP